MKTKRAITRDPAIHSGAPVFTGTRVAVQVLFDYLAEGQTVADFVRHYPTVSRAQAFAAIDEMQKESEGTG